MYRVIIKELTFQTSLLCACNCGLIPDTLYEKKSSKYLLTCKWNKEGAKYLDRNVIFSLTSPWIGLFPCTIRSQNCDYLVPRGTSSVY